VVHTALRVSTYIRVGENVKEGSRGCERGEKAQEKGGTARAMRERRLGAKEGLVRESGTDVARARE
jgi:hypothetical protein